MNYGTLSTLNDILKTLQADIATIGFTIAGLMMVVCAILIMLDSDTSVAAHTKRWDKIRIVFLCAVVIAAAAAIIAFGQQIGNALHG